MAFWALSRQQTNHGKIYSVIRTDNPDSVKIFLKIIQNNCWQNGSVIVSYTCQRNTEVQ